MSQLIPLIQTYGLLIVFGTVLLEQGGLPIPAYPILIVAGAMAASGEMSWPLIVLVSVLACLISDFFWFRAGRFYGKRILKLLCRISLSPDYCVSQTEDRFTRYGVKSLVVAKFIPGFNTIAQPIAGAMGVSTARFVLFSMLGGALWSSVGIGLGLYFHASVAEVLAAIDALGGAALSLLALLLSAFILYKYLERRRYRDATAVERIMLDDVLRLLAEGHDPLIVDARSATARQLDAAIPGAVAYGDCDHQELMAALDRDRHIVIYCSCPNDVTAAEVAQQFLKNGFHRARPLKGGLDAWNAHHAQFGADSAAAPAQAGLSS
jgi:membrane protein DedA with SNARE-associated domain/rhodanese-related sulfurtransferase